MESEKMLFDSQSSCDILTLTLKSMKRKIDKEKNVMASNCQIPTPEIYVDQMLDYIGYSGNLYGKKVLENSCGEGNILLKIVMRYIESAKRREYTSCEIKEGLQRDIVAYEIDNGCIEKCKNRLNEFANSCGIQNVNWNLNNKDFLKEEVADFYDYVIGNPPYITYHDMDEEQRKLLKDNYETCKSGRSDYCYAFIEASIRSLADTGKMVYLVPYSIMTNKFAGTLRKFIQPHIREIYDYRTIKIFPEALTSSVIIICEKEKDEKHILFHLVAEKRTLEIPKKKLGKKWVVLGTQNLKGKKFGEYFEVRNSVATLYNKAFVLTDYKYIDRDYIVGNYKIEGELVKDAVSTKSLNKKHQRDKIIFPYQIINDQKIDYTEDEFRAKFPGATEYFEQFKEALKARKADKNAKWFQYGRSQAVTKVEGEKLIIPMVITQMVHVYEAGKDAIPYAGYFIKCKKNSELKLDDAKEILESRDFYKYVEICGTPTTPTSYRISVDDIKEYMIVRPRED